jgi:hypothetical protein
MSEGKPLVLRSSFNFSDIVLFPDAGGPARAIK